ncbi:hypothetical protein [Paenibacillus odorifer]|uniref:hypothetical protein n=1 Tax=Paenibacillus odorifer TaxID=189426 RepID=UPI00096FAE88|nr:hypothetical protein [Paenibacillus odorifer]OME59466.1 hypothetical protein BSK61_05935 [Paenibacillus odorifer]
MTLTREEIQGMKSGKKLNDLVMQHIFKMKKEPVGESFTWVYEVDGKIMDWRPHYFNPSADISAAWEVEEFIAKRNDHGWYVRALCDVVGTPRDGTRVLAMDDWRMLHAKPEQRCKAALLAVLNL